MSFKDGNIYLKEELNQDNLSDIIKGLAYHIALQYIGYLNDDYLSQDEFEYTIRTKDGTYALRIKLNEYL